MAQPQAPDVLGEPCDDLGCWFGLSRASYLTLPRSLMEAMPEEWQARMAELLFQASAAFEYPRAGSYEVRLRDQETGRYLPDPLADYRHPDQDLIEAHRLPRRP
jgi:hypothetical protein